MKRLYSSIEITDWENNDLAIEAAVEKLKSRLGTASPRVLADVLERCDPETHGDLMDWISDRTDGSGRRRLPRAWSPKRNRSIWLLYAAADLKRPEHPPRR